MVKIKLPIFLYIINLNASELMEMLLKIDIYRKRLGKLEKWIIFKWLYLDVDHKVRSAFGRQSDSPHRGSWVWTRCREKETFLILNDHLTFNCINKRGWNTQFTWDDGTISMDILGNHKQQNQLKSNSFINSFCFDVLPLLLRNWVTPGK